jgi:hypothetical protein
MSTGLGIGLTASRPVGAARSGSLHRFRLGRKWAWGAPPVPLPVLDPMLVQLRRWAAYTACLPVLFGILVGNSSWCGASRVLIRKG